jgi:hypothetical protein
MLHACHSATPSDPPDLDNAVSTAEEQVNY